MNIVLLNAYSLQGHDLTFLKAYGTVTIYDVTDSTQVRERITNQHIILNNRDITPEHLEGNTTVKLILCLSTGTNFVDTQYCKAHNIAVCNVPSFSTPSVAQHAVALLLELTNHTRQNEDLIRSGRWSSSTCSTFTIPELQKTELLGKCCCMVGLGSIGRQIARVLEAFGCTVVYHSVSGASREEPWPRVSFDEMLATADVVMIQCPLTTKTQRLFTEAVLRRMKPTALVVNVGRGAVVDEAAMAAAVDAGRIAGYATDVFAVEPLPADHPLLAVRDHTRVVVTPHIAWYSRETVERLLASVRETVRLFVEAGEFHNRVV